MSTHTAVTAEDPEMKAAVNELGDALEAALLGASEGEINRVIAAVDVLIEVKIAQFVEMAADRVAAFHASA